MSISFFYQMKCKIVFGVYCRLNTQPLRQLYWKLQVRAEDRIVYPGSGNTQSFQKHRVTQTKCKIASQGLLSSQHPTFRVAILVGYQ